MPIREVPQLGTGPTRRVGWLELFFDLAFVVIVRQLTGMLHGAPELADFTSVAGLLAIAWIAWLTVTGFVNLWGDGRSDWRIPLLISMAGVGLIAVSIPEATSGAAPLFVAGLAVTRTAVWPLWVKAERGEKSGAVRAAVHGPGISVAWLASMLVPDAARPWVWLGLVVAELIYSASGFGQAPFAIGHLLDRVGLFVMIVLGESILELVLAVRPDQSPLAWAVTAGAFVLVCAIWWQYFQQATPLTGVILDHSSGTVLRDVVGVAHFFVVLGLIGIAAGLGSAIEQADAPHLPYGSVIALGGGIGVYHFGNVMVAWRFSVWPRHLALLTLVPVVVAAVFAIFGGQWPAWLLVLLLVAYMGADQLMRRRMIRQFEPDAAPSPTQPIP